MRVSRCIQVIGLCSAIFLFGYVIPSSQAQRSPSIVRGEDATADWMVLLTDRDEPPAEGQFCGGSLIAPDVVLTAAHCVVNRFGFTTKPEKIEAIVGIPDMMHMPGRGSAITGITVHPKYDSHENLHDIALLKLERSHPGPVMQYAKTNRDIWSRRIGTAYGWGETESYDSSTHLQSVRMRILSNRQCHRREEKFIQRAQMCTSTHRRRDTCHGDSGGPLVISHKKRSVLVGVVSWGDAVCARKGSIGVYTRAGKYHRWIRTTVQSYRR